MRFVFSSLYLLGALLTACESFRGMFGRSISCLHKSGSSVCPRNEVLNMDTTRTTVVFDIDDTLCYIGNNYRKKHPEFEVKHQSGLDHVMFPHFNLVLEFLLKHNCYVSFFSAGIAERNVPLLNDVLSGHLGKERCNQLKKEGQFQVFSRQHNAMFGKPLEQALKPGHTINDIMLVDDRPGNAMNGEEPLIQISYDGIGNTMYYLLGLFMDYFKTAAPKGKSLRQYFDKLKKYKRSNGTCWIPKSRCKFIAKGLKEVRKTVPEAVYYFNDDGYYGDNRHGSVDMKDVVPPIRHIEKILARNCTTFSDYHGDDAMTTTFMKHVTDYFVPYYKDKLSAGQKERLPKHMKKLILS